MTDQSDAKQLLQIVLGVEQPAALGHDAKHAEQTGADISERDSFGVVRAAAASISHYRSDTSHVEPEVLERVALALEEEHFVACESPHRRGLHARHGRREPDQTVAVRIGEGTQHDGVENGEDCRRRAERQGERDDGHCRERGSARQGAERVFQLSTQCVPEIGASTHAKHLLVDGAQRAPMGFHIAKAMARLGRRRLTRHA